MIKAIIFDFGGVIYETKWKEFDEFFSKKNGFSILVANSEDKELIRIYKDSDLGKENFKKFFFRINPNIKDINKVLSDYKEGYSKFKIINKKLLKIIKNLREKGLRLFGFTDIKREHYKANIVSGIYNGFEEVFASYKFGHLKSKAEAFEKLIEELRRHSLDSSECIFIDDNLENIQRAREAGFEAIHYKDFPNTDNLEKELFGKLRKK